MLTERSYLFIGSVVLLPATAASSVVELRFLLRRIIVEPALLSIATFTSSSNRCRLHPSNLGSQAAIPLLYILRLVDPRRVDLILLTSETMYNKRTKDTNSSLSVSDIVIISSYYYHRFHSITIAASASLPLSITIAVVLNELSITLLNCSLTLLDCRTATQTELMSIPILLLLSAFTDKDGHALRRLSVRKRQGFRLLDPIGYQLPSCSHGPCLLFERRTQQTTEKFFACAVYRSQKRCSFRLNISSETTSSNLNSDVMNVATTSFGYATIRKKVNLLRTRNEKIYYCVTCNDVFSLSHVHPIKGPFGIASLRRPSQLFSAHIRNDSESQYWFAEESLTVLVNAVEKSGCDGILCIGTPTIFEHFQSHKLLRQKTKSFLLDIDARFVPFFRSSHFAVYSMLTNHFYDPKVFKKLSHFWINPSFDNNMRSPFGVFVEALTNSIRQLREQFFTCSVGKLKIIIVLPVFVGKRFLNCSDFHMLDYRNNTLMFKKPPQSFQANTCKHCSKCGRCVKSTYKHCLLCDRCHLPQRCRKFRILLLK
ncbi:hypothetical protein DINM_000457, partial [Dirofilaria immitis]|nr:hypothetical protein [Dirofilaria immitis]